MNEKYIIELNDEMQLIFKIVVTKNGNAYFIYAYKDDLEKLDKYTDDAYKRGYEDSKKEKDELIEAGDIVCNVNHPNEQICITEINEDGLLFGIATQHSDYCCKGDHYGYCDPKEWKKLENNNED